MRALQISENEENQRLDRFLGKYLNKATKGFIGKIIRKKYIKVNGKREEGSYILKKDDRLEVFLAEDTVQKFRDEKTLPKGTAAKEQEEPPIAYEDEHLLVWNKPSGILTHGADDGVVESALRYLMDTGAYRPEKERIFVPSSTNRLDKNTSGLVFIPKDNPTRMDLNEKWRIGQVEKYYITLIHGNLEKACRLEGYLTKDEKENKSTVWPDEKKGGKKVVTILEPVKGNGTYTLVQVDLHTGRSHQIRAHLQSIGMPVIGDPKYGDPVQNKQFCDRYGLKNQFLHNHKTVVQNYQKNQDLVLASPLPKELKKITDDLFGR